MTSTEIEFVQRGGKNKIDSRVLAKNLEIDSHKQWLHDLIFCNPENFIVDTGDDIDIDYQKNKRGKPTRFVWFTEAQFYYIISKSNNTPQVTRIKAMTAQKLAELRNKSGEAPCYKAVWEHNTKRLLVNKINDKYLKDPEKYVFYHEEKIINKFSPDEYFAKFLSKLERETGYVLPWTFEFDERECLPVPTEYQKKFKQYNEISQHEDEDITNMWGNEDLPFTPFEYCSERQAANCWINAPDNLIELWHEFIKKACACVDAYNDPNRKEKYGLPTHKEVQEGTYPCPPEDPDFIPQPLKELLEVSEKLKDANDNRIKILGFQVHRDWLQWLKSDDQLAQSMRKFYLGSDAPVNFYAYRFDYPLLDGTLARTSGDTFIVEYPQWSTEVDGFTLSERPDYYLLDAKQNPNAPLFKTIRLYDNKYKFIFDWYLHYLWLPQHSLKFFEQCDPVGYPQLTKVLQDLSEDTQLPMMFVQSVQKQLIAS
jgi:hypothetical protein